MEPRTPLQIGEAAPDFALPAVHRDGVVSLADYRDRSAVLLALFRGLYCPFCRRHIAQLGGTRERLRSVGVETLGIVATTAERARLYFRFHPSRLPLAADPHLVTHRTYGAPNLPLTPQLLESLQAVRVNPTGELPEPLPVAEAAQALDRLDQFVPTTIDHGDYERHGVQVAGQFLIDRDGIVRWANLEGAQEGLSGIGRFPTDEELLAAARAAAA